jgi:hypothetical protein
MGRDEGDFEKGEADGAAAALRAVAAAARVSAALARAEAERRGRDHPEG